MRKIIVMVFLPLFGLGQNISIPIKWTHLVGMSFDSTTNTLTGAAINNWQYTAQSDRPLSDSGEIAIANIDPHTFAVSGGIVWGFANGQLTSSPTYSTVKYGFYITRFNITVYNNGFTSTVLAVPNGFTDVRITVGNGLVKWFLNDALVYTTSEKATTRLYAVATIGYQANSITGATMTRYVANVPVTGIGHAKNLSANARNSKSVGSGLATVVPPATTTSLVPGIAFRFSLDTSSMTSALVYDADSNLVRTLWSGIRYPAGSFDTAWDGKTDSGNIAPDGNYRIYVTSNNIYATYLGVIGNNSDSTHGPTVWRTQNVGSLTFPNAHTGYALIRNTEGTKFLFKFDTLHIHQKTPVFLNTQYQTCSKSCTDGSRVYIISTWPHATINDYYVHCAFAMDVRTDKVYHFSAGSDAGSASVAIHSAIDTAIIPTKNYTAAQIGKIAECIAVQRSGNLFFVGTYGGTIVHNKITGALIAQNNIVGTNMVCDATGNLWIDSVKYAVSNSGLFTKLFSIVGISYPMGMDISPDNSTLAVIDGSSQQVKFYNNLTGAATSTLGQPNGYYGNAVVANDKFYFKDDRGDYFVSVTYQPDGSFWVNDAGNNRLLHFNADRSYKDFIMFQPSTYFSCVDPANVTHAYMGYLRFDMDYSNPNKIKWLLARNYGARRVNSNIDGDFDKPSAYFTLSNNRTYAAVSERDHNNQFQFEVTDTGFRKTGVILKQSQMDPAGNILQLGYNNGQSWNIYYKKLLGFDSNNNPYYSANRSSEHVPAPRADDPVYAGPVNLANRFSDSSFPFQDNGLATNYHVGILKHGSAKWKIKVARPTSKGYFGPFPTNGYFDIGNTVQYPAAISTTHKDILYDGYNGEFWKQTQTNMFNLFYKNGAFLYQFGKLGTNIKEEADIGYAGNAKLANVVTIPATNSTYLFHQDESIHGGLLYWGIYNTDEVVTKTYAVVKKGTPVLTFKYERLMTGLIWHTELPDRDISGWIRNRSASENWHVYTGQASWELNDLPDLFCFYNGKIDSSRNVTKRMTTPVSNSDWNFSGQLLFDFNSVATNATAALEVLDDANKIIARVTMLQDSSNGNNAVLAMNNRFLGSFNKPNGTVYSVLPNWIDFNIKNVGNSLQLTYNNVMMTTTTLVDGNARIHRACSVRLNFTGSPGSSGKGMGIKNLTFKRN